MQTYSIKTGRGTRPAISCPAGRPVCVDSGRPAGYRRVYELRPAGRTQFRFWPAGRPPGYLCIGGRSFCGWLAVWLCLGLQLAKVLAGRPADGWLYLRLAKVLAGRLAGCLAGWHADSAGGPSYLVPDIS